MVGELVLWSLTMLQGHVAFCADMVPGVPRVRHISNWEYLQYTDVRQATNQMMEVSVSLPNR